MGEPKQQSKLEQATRGKTKPQVEHCSPSDDVVDEFIRAVSDKVGKADTGDLSITQMRQGFGSFVKTVIRIKVKQKSGGGFDDKEQD